MISSLGRDHRGGTLSISNSWALYSRLGRGSNDNKGAHSRHARVGACYGDRGGGGSTEGPTVAELGPNVKVPTGGVGPGAPAV